MARKIQRCLWLEKDLNTTIKDKANDLGLTVTAYIKIAIHEKINNEKGR
ncbi:hypothetical protein LGL08_23040 [Clostridium estertheticum]|nr:hypothetical protein [Clostridium estertheticum]MCB2309424.1 hypothetical protein [Clostridium estertheticum]MCB2347860.1 hypothetical protein [Clostridium estertheticum]MCB2352379.1 hypothetical protein [Clostridium estertheticum]WAG48569.1 hypothetical protein LL127_23745 [Clostridium estertheticum]